MSAEPMVFDVPDVDRAVAMLLLGVIAELRDKSLMCTEAVKSALWHTLFETVEDGGQIRITGRSKISDETLNWLAQASGRDFIATVLAHMSESLQTETLDAWDANPNERPALLAGLRRWQEEFKLLWREMVERGERPLMTVLKERGVA